MRLLRTILPHLSIIMALMLMTFLVIDHFNRAMNFVDNNLFKGLALAFCLTSLSSALLLIAENRRR